MRTASGIELRDLAIGDAGWLIARHAETYAAEEGFDISFEALVADVLARFIRSRDPARERAFIAWKDGRRIGSIFCVRLTDEIAKIRLFFLEPDMRGRGLGRDLLQTCMGYARDKDYRRMELWTLESAHAAGALYLSSGFTLVTSHPTHAFGREVVEQEWEIVL